MLQNKHTSLAENGENSISVAAAAVKLINTVNSLYYGLSLMIMRTLTRGPYSVRDNES